VRADLLIAGGGPAGLATAIHAAERGLSAVVVDRRSLPLDTACADGLMPRGVGALRALGITLPGGASMPFGGIRFVDDHDAPGATFPVGRGLGVRRTVLVEAMIARAEDLGVTLRYACEARAWTDHGDAVALETSDGALEGRWLVGADGLTSAVRRAAGLELPACGRPRYGMRRRFAMRPWSPFVEIHWTTGAQALVTPTGPDDVVVTILSGGGGDFETGLRRFPALQARLAGTPGIGAGRGAGPLYQRVRRRHRGNVALVGDAAGYVDALTGEGLGLAFRSAAALADVLGRGRPLAAYERAYRRLVRDHALVTRLLLAIAARPRLRRRFIRGLARDPRTFERLVGVLGGETALSVVDAAHLVRLGWTLVRAGRPPAGSHRDVASTPRA
jgi:flavin-dependent dehydrogenase